MKTCVKCNRAKPPDEFYSHAESVRRHIKFGKCKECARADAHEFRAAKREHYSTYDREREQRPERKQAKVTYQQRHRGRNPDRYKARVAVSNALRDGRLIRSPCVYCNTTDGVEGHHVDYSKPLDVVWACFKCHREYEHGQVVVAKQQEEERCANDE